MPSSLYRLVSSWIQSNHFIPYLIIQPIPTPLDRFSRIYYREEGCVFLNMATLLGRA